MYCHPADRLCLEQMGARVIIALLACYDAHVDPAACQMECQIGKNLAGRGMVRVKEAVQKYYTPRR